MFLGDPIVFQGMYSTCSPCQEFFVAEASRSTTGHTVGRTAKVTWMKFGMMLQERCELPSKLLEGGYIWHCIGD